MVKLLSATPKAGYKIHLQYDDGQVGDVDLSDLIGKGVFAALSDTDAFNAVTVGKHGELRWTDELELCADALYLQISGKSAEELFPNLKARANA